MQGKYQRTEKVDFFGNKYRTFTCTRCKVKYEAMTIDRGTLCGPCTNPTLEEYIDDGMDYSKSFDECFRDSARLEREWHDKHKHTETD